LFYFLKLSKQTIVLVMRGFNTPFTALVAVLFLFGISKAANLQVCSTNFQNRYFVIYAGLLGKSNQEQQAQKAIEAQNQIPGGILFATAQGACNAFGLQLANITADIVPDMVALYQTCTPNLIQGIWFGWYEGLPIPFGCNYLLGNDSVDSDILACTTGFKPVLCEIPFIPIVITTTTTSTTETGGTFTSDVTVFTTTTTVTSFFVTHITETIVSGTVTFTTLTSTTTSCSTITLVHTHHCCPRQKFDPEDPRYKNCRPCQFTETSIVIETVTASPIITTRTRTRTTCTPASTSTTTTTRTRTSCPPVSTVTTTVTTSRGCCDRGCCDPSSSSSSECGCCDSSSSSGDCGCQSSSSSSDRNCCHHRFGKKISPGCHDCSNNNWWEKEEAWNDNNKQLKRVSNPKQIPPFYQACAVSLNNYFLVHLVNGSKSAQAPEVDGQVACSALGYNFANVTIEALINLIPLFAACDVTSGTFNAFYDYIPFCGIFFPLLPGMVMNDYNNDLCTNAFWALCRAGPAAVVSSSVPTGPFTTITFTSTSTDVATVVESVTVIETITARGPSTFTSSSFFPTTTTTSTTETFTITDIALSTTSCCCNPVECTSISVCCRRPR
jgi:hypothetical protein